MDLNGFIPGRTSEFAYTREYELERITVPSGRLLIRDPFEPHEYGCVILVTPGSYRAWITAIDPDYDQPDHAEAYRPAYLSVQLSLAPTVRIDYADDLMEPPVPNFGAWTGADHGIIALHDADALLDNDIPALTDEWDRTLNSDEPYPFGCGNLPLPGTDRCNIVFSRSGWGDGAFPVLATFDASGRSNAIHVDFGLVDVTTPRSEDKSRSQWNESWTLARYRAAAMTNLTLAAALLGAAIQSITTGGSYLFKLVLALVLAFVGVCIRAKYRKQTAQKREGRMRVDDLDRAGRTPLHYTVGDDPVGLNYTAALTDPALAEENFRTANEYKIANTTRLLAHGADVNAADHEGLTPLHAAGSRDSVDVVRLLLDAGADINAADNKGETALYKAVRNTTQGKLPIARLLLERGADPNAPTANGSSPLEFVGRLGTREMREVFVDLL